MKLPPIVAVIPTRYEPDRLAALVDVIRPECRRVILLDNGHDPPVADGVDARGMSIYRMWNYGWELALETSPRAVIAFLNDDVRLLPGTLRRLAFALRDPTFGVVFPDRSRPLRKGMGRPVRYTVWRDPTASREMTGYCFMVRGDLPVRFDEGYGWWYGDTQFDEDVRLAGWSVVQVDGLPVEHISDAESNDWARRPELRDVAVADGERWALLHDRIENGRWVPR